MVIEHQIDPFLTWLPQAAWTWLMVAAVLTLVVLAFGYLVAAVQYGPTAALRKLGHVLSEAGADLAGMSPRRVLALAKLAVRESLRGRVLIVLAIFGLILLFAGWFLPRDENATRLYLSFVLTATTYLVLMLALFMSVFSLPNDIKSRTIYTVVTKPVRSGEIVLGRILGFGAVGTGLLAVMGLASYVFVVRTLSHDHQVDLPSIRSLDLPPSGGNFDGETIVQEGSLVDVDGHRHTFTMNADGFGVTDSQAGHWHVVERDNTPRVRGATATPGDASRVVVHFSEPMDPVEASRPENYSVSGGATIGEAFISLDNRQVTLSLESSAGARVGVTTLTINDRVKSRFGRELDSYDSLDISDEDPTPQQNEYEVGPPMDLFRARVPVYGGLGFRDMEGSPKERGVSVGSEWSYRSYIPGATQAAAVWTFHDVSEEAYGERLPLEIVIRVFRTHKGAIERGVIGAIFLKNPVTGQTSKPWQFLALDNQIDRKEFPRKLQGSDADGKPIDLDLYDDLVADGELEVWLQCMEGEQYYGVAQADAYLLARESSFVMNFGKGLFAIWLQMVLVTALGVMFSTFLSGPIAMMATMAAIVFGLFSDFIIRLSEGSVHGGGPVEAFHRMINQMNLVSKLEPGTGTNVIYMLDKIIQKLLWCAAKILPDFNGYSRAQYVADGFNIPADHVLITGFTLLGYLIPVLLAGYFLLKTREIAQ